MTSGVKMKKDIGQMSYAEIRNARYEIAVLPWGSCEPHGLHLPYGIDTLVAGEVARRACDAADSKGAHTVLLPPIPIGVNTNTLSFPLTLNMNPMTEFAVLKDIVASVEAAGLRKLVVLNGHGGNEFKFMFRELYGKTKVFMFLINWWEAIDKKLLQETIEDRSGEHADETETSWALYLFPELVHMEQSDDGRVRRPGLGSLADGIAWFTRPWHLATVNSGYGNPVKASAEKGRVLVENAVEKIARFLKELSEADIDADFPYPAGSGRNHI